MKIVIDARLYGLEHTGLGRYVSHLVTELSLLSTQHEFHIFLRKKYYETLHLPSNFHKHLVDLRHYSLREHFLLPRLIHTISPDIVHFPHFNVPLFTDFPYVVTIHDLLMHKQKGFRTTTLSLPLYLAKRLGYHQTFRHAVLASRRVIVPSIVVKDDVSTYYHLAKNKVQTIYEGISDTPLSLPTKEDVLSHYNISRPYFVYTGNAYPHKNLHRAIEAVSYLHSHFHIDALLVIASARDVFTKRLEKDLSVEEKRYVSLLGFVPDRELTSLYKYSLGFVYPSLSEGFGLPGLDAIAAGTVCLASDIPIFREIYESIPFYFNPYDFSSIAETMKLVYDMSLSDRAKRVSLGRAFVKRYSWATMARETLSVYEDAATSSDRL